MQRDIVPCGDTLGKPKGKAEPRMRLRLSSLFP